MKEVIKGFEALSCREKLVEIKIKHHQFQSEYWKAPQRRKQKLVQKMTELENSIDDLELEYFG